MSLTQNPRSLESIKLQRNYHLRQIDIILIKKEQFENYQMAIEHKHLNSICTDDFKDVQDDNKTLQVAIYRNMEEADSLLGLLIKKGSNMNSDSESIKSFSTTDTDDKPISIDTLDSSNSNIPIGSKHPKDQNTVIEELKVLNEQLHSLVYRLVTQLDASVKENNILKERIKQLENEKIKGDILLVSRQFHKNSLFIVNVKSSNNLKVITDSSGGTSPFVFSPNSELSPDVHDRTLPPLAPLDLPNFEFPGFVKNNSHAVNTGN